jgi:hypothetical protein
MRLTLSVSLLRRTVLLELERDRVSLCDASPSELRDRHCLPP